MFRGKENHIAMKVFNPFQALVEENMFKKILSALIVLVFALPLTVLAANWTLTTKVATQGGKLTVNGGADQLYGLQKTVSLLMPQAAVPVVVTANPGYTVAAILINGASQALPIASPTTFTMGSTYPTKTAQSLTAYFTPAKYNVSVTAGPGGSAGPSGVYNLNEGAHKIFVFSPNSGNKLIRIENTDGVTFTMSDYATGAAVATLPGAVGQKINVDVTATKNVTLDGVFVEIIAEAGADQTVLVNSPASVTASAQVPDGDSIGSYVWTQISGPGYFDSITNLPKVVGNDATLTLADVGPVATQYGFKVTVTSTAGLSSTDTVKVNVVTSVTDAVLTQCQGCHNSNGVGAQADVYNKWLTSPHQANTVMCYNCHIGTNTGAHPGTTPTSSTCEGCHGTQHGTQYPECLNCHEPHSAAGAGGEGCTFCHAYPPTSGAHAAHFGLTESSGPYADTQTLEERNPTASIDSAPTVYAYGCAICHSIDEAKHMNGQVDVILYEAAADLGSLKALAAPTAAYDPNTGTCSGTYCHSTGQATPTYQTTPAWTSVEALSCDGCHGNPPSYPSGGEGAATANTHLILADDGYNYGHFTGLPGPWHGNQHGGSATVNSAPITCQTCHYETTDPSNTGPNGFYYLDTTGNYRLAGNVDPSYEDTIQCGYCHNPEHPNNPATAPGKVLPLRHVNGKRDVIFDPREELPPSNWLPAVPNRPTRPYWLTGASKNVGWPADATWNGTTVSFGLSDATYNPTTKTCSNTECHLEDRQPVWGRPIEAWSWGICGTCHESYYGGY